jgi:hypothetical protein
MPDRWRGLEVFFAGVVAFFTIVLVGVSYYQWKVADKAAEAAKDSAGAAKAAAQSAQTANQLSLQSLVITERPYVYNKRFLLKPLKVGEKATITADIENMGKLDAQQFGEGAIVEFRTSTPPGIEMKSGILTDLVPHVAKTMTFSSPDAVTSDQLRAIRSGALTLFIYGFVRYQTDLLKGEVTITTFCSSYDLKYGLELVGCDHPPNLSINGKVIEMPNTKVGP